MASKCTTWQAIPEVQELKGSQTQLRCSNHLLNQCKPYIEKQEERGSFRHGVQAGGRTMLPVGVQSSYVLSLCVIFLPHRWCCYKEQSGGQAGSFGEGRFVVLIHAYAIGERKRQVHKTTDLTWSSSVCFKHETNRLQWLIPMGGQFDVNKPDSCFMNI